jgi:phosphatidylglycerophosphatase C
MSDAARVVLFDFDGTLVRGDSVARLLRDQLRASRWRYACAVFGLPLLPLFRWWRTAWLPATWFLWLASIGRSDADLQAARTAFCARSAQRRDALLIGSALHRLQRHVDAGDTVVIVTGATAETATALWQALGGPAVQVIGSRIERRFGGHVSAFHCYGPRKLRALAAHGLHPPFAAMYSDSAADLPLLSCAQQPVLVADDARLIARLRRRLPRLEVLPASS